MGDVIIMITIKDYINKIKWGPKEKKEDYRFYYIDRVNNELKEIRFLDIKDIEGGFMIIHGRYEDVEIPLHRIREVKRNGIVVWRR